MMYKKVFSVVILIALALSAAGQLILSASAPELRITSNESATFSTSYIRITNAENELIIEPDSARGQILAIIDQNPGIHFREICQMADRQTGVVQYHVQVLMAFKNISQFRDGRYTRYVINNSTLYDGFTRIIVSAWNRPLDKQILSELYNNDKKKHCIAQLARNLGMSRQAISAHVNKLKESGLVDLISADGDGTKYFALTGPARAKLEFLSTRRVIDCSLN
jgi:predicted transcriptional regulator